MQSRARQRKAAQSNAKQRKETQSNANQRKEMLKTNQDLHRIALNIRHNDTFFSIFFCIAYAL